MCVRSSTMRARLKAACARDVGLDQLVQEEQTPDGRGHEGWRRSDCEDEQSGGRNQVGSGREEDDEKDPMGLSAQ